MVDRYDGYKTNEEVDAGITRDISYRLNLYGQERNDDDV